MANIDKELHQIKNAVYGREVRGSIHDGIKKINEETEKATDLTKDTERRQNAVEQQFDDVLNEWTSDKPISNEETVAARTNRETGENWTTIGQRLDAENKKVTAQLAGVENLENYELNSRARKKQGHIVFISDDGHRGDWEILKPIFEAANVPFCLAIVSDWSGSNRMTDEQLLYLQNEMGCEILSHSKTHNSPKSLIDMSETELRHELSESRNELIRRGFDVQSFRVPGNRSDIKVRKIAREYYRAMVVSNQGDMNDMNYQPYETYDLKSIWLDNESYGGAKSFDYYKEHIDRANEEGALLIISTHGYALDGVEKLMEQVVQYAKNKSNVCTLREALNKTGNIIEVGDYSRSKRLDRLGGKHFVVGADGTVSGGIYIADMNEFNSDSRWEFFPFGLTLVPISTESAKGFPDNEPGLLENYKTRIQQYSHNYQEYKIIRSNKRFIRHLDPSGNWTDWEPDSPVFIWGNNKGTFNSGIEYYNLGLTYEYVTSRNIDIEFAPERKPGVRITHKLSDGDPIGVNFQEYHLTFGAQTVYKRRSTSHDSWTDWVKL